MDGAKFSTNSATSGGVGGGAIYNTADAQIFLSGNTSFDSNISTMYGGAIYNAGSIRISNDGDTINFNDNKTNESGGAIYNNTTGSLTMLGDGQFVFESNTAKNGGAIGLGTNGNINGYVENSLFERNYAGDAGGVVAANTAITFVNSKFINNSARFSGGAISYNPQNSSVGKYLKLIADGADTVFAGNNVTESAGSGLQNEKGQEGIYIGNYTDVTSENDSIEYFNAGNSGSLIFNDIVNAAGGAKDDNGKPYTRNGINKNIQLNRDGVSYGKLEPTSANATTNLAPTNGKIIFNNTVRGANLVLHNGTLAFGQSNSYGSYVEAENVG